MVGLGVSRKARLPPIPARRASKSTGSTTKACWGTTTYHMGAMRSGAKNFWLQEDGATRRAKKTVRAFAKANFPNVAAGRPASSPDISPIGFSARGHLDAAAREQSPKTLAGLKRCIVKSYRAYPAKLRKKKIIAFCKRLATCVEAGREHFEYQKQDKNNAKKKNDKKI
jgi:hypothetical protein